MKKEILIVLLLSLSFVLNSFAQNESTLLHLDKAFYVTGEVVWYKFYLPTSMKDQEATFEVVISDKEGTTLNQYYLQTEGENYVQGYYKIPFDIASNWYRISLFSIADTENSLVSAIFPIYNDLKITNDSGVAESKVEKLNNLSSLDDLDIQIELDQTNYSTRAPVQVTVNIKDQNGQAVASNFSVSVSDAELVNESLSIKGNIPKAISDQITVTGTVVDENGDPIKVGVLGMYSSLEDRIYYSSADQEGHFAFKPPNFYGNRPIQFVGYQFEREDISIKMNNRKMPRIDASLSYPDRVKNYLALSRQRKKIFQIYTALENQIEPEKVELDIQPLKPGFSYIIKDYESFDFMYSFFGELITPLKFNLQKDSTYTATLYNPTGRASANTALSGKPLFIIDGKLTRDADFVARMDMDYIEQVDLFYKTDELRENFSAIGRSGVVKITTNLRNVSIGEKEAEDIFTISGLQPKAAFPVFDPNNLTGNQPFFRPQLYWNPDLKTDKKGQANFTFYQSDDVSNFVIRIVAQGENGEFGRAAKTYQVKL